MRYKLLNLREEVEKGEAFGTCDLCFYVADHHYRLADFECLDTGEKFTVELGYWDYDYYFEHFQDTLGTINYLDFAVWLEKQDLPDVTKWNDSFRWLLEVEQKYWDEEGEHLCEY